MPGDKVSVIAEGVDGKIYFPKRFRHQPYVFLSVGKYEGRKSTDELVSAFSQEFPAGSGAAVELWLKADFPMFPDRVLRLKDTVKHDPRIKVISGVLSEYEIAELYHSADSFLFPSKAEAGGLPCLEALACGLPTLAVNYSGQTEYLNALQGLFIPIKYELAEIQDKDYEYFYKDDYAGSSYGVWAIPNVASIRQGMRQLYSERDIWAEKALLASSMVREKFSWRAAAKKALRRLAP
jgi:glycosyltransferase involved in cell wall biosynthesis